MPRKRDISPDLWTDGKVLSLPWPAVGFYVGLISQADDAGRLEWDDRELAARICGAREDATLADVRGWMEAVAEVGLVRVYRVGERDYAYHPRWGRHQYINRAKGSHLPDPDGDHASVSEASVNGQGAVSPRARPRVAPRTASGTASVSAHPPTPLERGGVCGDRPPTRAPRRSLPVNPVDARIDAIAEGRY